MRKSMVTWDWSEDGRKWTSHTPDLRARLERVWAASSSGGTPVFELKIKGETTKYDAKTMIQTAVSTQKQAGLRRRIIPCCSSNHELVYNPGTTGQARVCYDCNKSVKESYRCPEECCSTFVRCMACQGPEFAEVHTGWETQACLPWWSVPGQGAHVYCPNCNIAQTAGANCSKCGVFLAVPLYATAPPTYVAPPTPVEHKLSQEEIDQLALEKYVASLKNSFSPVFANQPAHGQSPTTFAQDHQRLDAQIAALRQGIQQVPIPVDSLEPPPYASVPAPLSREEIDHRTLEQRVDNLKQSFAHVSLANGGAALALQDSQRLEDQVASLRQGIRFAADPHANLSVDQWVSVQSQRAVDPLFDFLNLRVRLSIDESLAICKTVRERGLDWAGFQGQSKEGLMALGLNAQVAMQLDAALGAHRAGC